MRAPDAVPRRHALHHASARPAPTHTTSRTGTLDARAAHALQYHPQHVLHQQHAPRWFLIAFSYATAIYLPHHSTRAAWRKPNTTPSLTR
ncbi:hypothetical protein K438DRAFT_2017201 [Mycena galopus ATCC 62051]|nr:hypothetical protein K438DRAFT_2017201 [Mycena galopus ATCC 62051]